MFLVSYEFGLFFLILIFAFYLIPDRGRPYLLLVFSLLFYISGGIQYLLYPLITAVSTFFLGKRIGRITADSKAYIKEQNMERTEKAAYNKRVKKRQRRLLTAGLVLNFGILSVLKYTDFILYNVGLALTAAGIQGEMEYTGWLLPLGISYYTFQTMGYLIDVYNRKYEPEQKLSRFSLFVLFFLPLTAGPISRYDSLKEEFAKKHPFQLRQIIMGGERMLWGYFKKLVVADRLAPAVSILTNDPASFHGAYFLTAMILSTLQLYADFSGAMDIVIGAAEMFGIRLPENFDRPFSSRSLAELWRRWHMTLMQWLREYIFYPVSASRFCKKISSVFKKIFGKKAGAKVPVYVASITVWFITGIWHGASWNYISWGLANCAVLLVSQELSGTFKSLRKRFPVMESGLYAGFERVRTFFVFAFLQMFLYYPFSDVLSLTGSLFTDFFPDKAPGGFFELLGLSAFDLAAVLFGVCMMAGVSRMGKQADIRERLFQKPEAVRYLAVFALFLSVLLLGVYGHGYDASQFIYNQF